MPTLPLSKKEKSKHEFDKLKVPLYNWLFFLHLQQSEASFREKKLSKQNRSPEVTIESKQSMLQTLHKAVSFLGQTPPELHEFEHIEDFWEWSMTHFSIDNIPKTMNIVFDDDNNV